MKLTARSSPNCDSREGQAIDMLVLHYTGMKSAEDALNRLTDVAAKVSAHYMVDEDGTIYRLVEESQRAWHAGKSFWRGHTNINQRSIGIEIVNPGHEFGYRPFPKVQMQAVAELCTDILKRHAIDPRNVVAHSDIAPVRKEDPGELFDWAVLAGQGIGLWPEKSSEFRVQSSEKSSAPTELRTPDSELFRYGYDITDLAKAILAFQRHFRPKDLTGQWDNECDRLLASLLSSV